MRFPMTLAALALAAASSSAFAFAAASCSAFAVASGEVCGSPVTGAVVAAIRAEVMAGAGADATEVGDRAEAIQALAPEAYLAVLRPRFGDFLGEIALIDGRERTATATASCAWVGPLPDAPGAPAGPAGPRSPRPPASRGGTVSTRFRPLDLALYKAASASTNRSSFSILPLASTQATPTLTVTRTDAP